MIYQLVKSDQAPQILANLKREDDNSVINFAGGTCSLKFRAKGTTNTLFTLAAQDSGDNFKLGYALFTFSGTQLNLDEGYYEGEISIVYNTGKIETVYQILDFYLRTDFV
jgi:hypothetical protein|tara:strand:+ start:192 stop:521 length:330 start_codon:yes stop_codon:yes gene_type:complete